MKKTYSAPCTEMVEQDDSSCLCLSLANEAADESQVLDRGNRNNLWDDEEE